MDNYQAPPTAIKGTTTSSNYNSQFKSEGEGTIAKTFVKVLLTTTVALTMSMPSAENQNETTRSSYVKTLANSQSTSGWKNINTKAAPSKLDNQEPIAKKSSRLQNAFGFKTAQWAAVLKLERKTLYNWKKYPNTTVQQKTQERIGILEAFAKEIDQEHQRYISKISFGRYSDPYFREVIVSKDLDYDALIDAYDQIYAKLDGQYKRDKHRKGLA